MLSYTCCNDVSVRDWKLKRGGGQWSRGKTFDTFSPLGPALVTCDEIANPNELNIRTVLNGEAELAKLGIAISDSTVRKYRPNHRRSLSTQTWKAFLHNHAKELVAIDFFTVPTAMCRVLYVFLVVAHERRKVLHFNITDAPSAFWTAQQMVEAFPFTTPPRYLLRDRDAIYGADFVHRVKSLGLEQKLIAPRSRWQNPVAERLIGSLRRECLDHVIVLNEKHLRGILTDYLGYYHCHRPHRFLAQDCPAPRAIELPNQGEIIELPFLGGLHHRYTRQAA